MNLWEIVQAIYAENEEDQPTSFATFLADDPNIADDILNAINARNDEICGLADWNFREQIGTTFNTVINQRIYTMPEGKVQYIQHEDSTYRLKKVDFEDIIDSTDVGTPTKYAFYANKLYLDPTPDAVKVITPYTTTNLFAKTSAGTLKASLSLETDLSIILPANLHYILVYGACIDHYKKPSKNQYVHWTKRYADLMSSLDFSSRNATDDTGKIITVNTNW